MENNVAKLLLGILATGLFLCLGCQESNKNVERRGKLQAHARYQLSGELEQKDNEIAALTLQVDNLKKQLAEQTRQTEDCRTKQGEEFMTIIGPIVDELDQAKAENEQLKAQLKNLSDSNAP